MSIELKVYDNGDHTHLVWLPTDIKPIDDCRGFAIKRIRNGHAPDYVHGFVGFSENDTLDLNNPWKFPVQRYMWWDYAVTPGDIVQYSIIPVIGPDKDHIQLKEDLASPTTPEMTVTGQCTPHLSAYFNKGMVAAQWVTRALQSEPKKNIKEIIANPKDPLRRELSGLLRPQILSLLGAARKQGGKLFAALYELNDPELIAALESFGTDCNLILANGAFKPPDNDENKEIRATLKHKVRVFDRIVSSGHFAHDKFMVVCDSNRKPQAVLTGSTNWTMTGLCTQANNALIIDDPAVAQDFLDAWDRIHAAGNSYPPTLAAANSAAKTFEVDGCKVTPWFVPTQNAQDLDYARKLINAAKDGILFLFFNPGTFQPDDEPEKWTLLQNILSRHHEENNAHYQPDLYIKGVVNQEIPLLTNDSPPKRGQKPPAGSMDPSAPAHSVALYKSGIEPPTRLRQDVLVPANIKTQFASWEQEMLGAGVHVHSKVIVVDPFGESPVVMTGSHNLGFKASSKNDDNLVIIEGNAPLAAAYAINIVAIYQSYRWNSYVEEHRRDPKVWHGLQDNDAWQQGYLTGDHLAEINFWLRPEKDPALHTRATAGSSSGQTVQESDPGIRSVHRINMASTHRNPNGVGQPPREQVRLAEKREHATIAETEGRARYKEHSA